MQALPKPIKVWLDSAGGLHRTVEEWQAAELKQLWARCFAGNTEFVTNTHQEMFATICLEQQQEMAAILTTGPASRPSARKKAGTTNPRRATRANRPTVQEPAMREQAVAGIKAMREAVDTANGLNPATLATT